MVGSGPPSARTSGDQHYSTSVLPSVHDKCSCSASEQPLVAATTTSRPITRNTASCVPLQVPIENLYLRLGQASSSVRLCNRPLAGAVVDKHTRRHLRKCGM